LALPTQHHTTNLQVRKKIDFSKKYGDLYGPEEGEDRGVKGLAELEIFEGDELALTVTVEILKKKGVKGR
jgi:hypothetical protein